MIAPARAAAYEALQAITSDTADLPHALARVRMRLSDERDRALTGEIVTGTVRWQAALDHVIAAFGRGLCAAAPLVTVTDPPEEIVGRQCLIARRAPQNRTLNTHWFVSRSHWSVGRPSH